MSNRNAGLPVDGGRRSRPSTVRPGRGCTLGATRLPGAASIRFEVGLAGGDDITLAVYDVQGRLLSEVYSGPAAMGSKSITWGGKDRRGVPGRSGVYFARLFSESHGVAATKVVFTR